MLTCNEFEMISDCDGLKLSGLYMVNPQGVKGIIQLVHGMAEHKERYTSFMRFLCSKGYACVIMDIRGHGKSVSSIDDLGFFNDSMGVDCVKDIHQLSLAIRKNHANIPYILFGHSMGSLLVRAYVKRYDDVDALIVCGSPSENHMTPLALKLVQVMSNVKGNHYRSMFVHNLAFSSYPKNFLETYSENVWLSKCKENVNAYDEDPLCGFVFTLNGFENLFHLLLDVYRKKDWNVKKNEMPILFVAGEDDPCIVSKKAFTDAYTTMKNVGYKNIKHHLFGEMRHEILMEKDCKLVYAYIECWLDTNVMRKL